MLDKDSNFKNLVNLESLKDSGQAQLDFDLYRLVSTKTSVEICVNNDHIVPHFKIEDLKNSAIEHLIEKITQNTQTVQDNSYILAAVTSLTLDLLLGRHKKQKKSERAGWYDVYVVNLHLGNYSFNLEMQNLNEFFRLLTYLSDTILLASTPKFRPFLRPVTDTEVNKIKEKMGKKFGEAEASALEQLKRHITQDFYRLLIFTNLYRRYSHLRNVDVKRRLIWTFKRTSLVYQLIMGKTLREVIDEEDKFLRHEFKYIERSSAIELNERLIWEDLFEIESGDDGINSYFGSIQPISRFLSKYFIQIRVTCNLSMSLLDAVGPRKMVKEIEANLNNMSLHFLKPKGKLDVTLDFGIESMDVKFKEEKPNYEKKIMFCQKSIENFLQNPMKRLAYRILT